MRILPIYKLTITALLLLTGGVLFAQKGTVDQPVTTSENDFYPPSVNKDWQPSLTPDGAWDRVSHKSKPIPWQWIREADILWKKRVWRDIDTREKQNVGFRYSGDENTGGGWFIEILLDGLKRGKIKAYSNMDDRFTQELSKEAVIQMAAGKDDTSKVYDPTTDTWSIKLSHTDFQPELISKYRVKEDWIFDRNQGKMVVRIVGIAPMKDIYGDDGQYRTTTTMFWIYYPDCRNFLAQYEVVNPLNDLARYTWDEFFESRIFTSKVIKISNPFNNSFENLGIYPNRMEALYEGTRVNEEIFNKEHDMWVY